MALPAVLIALAIAAPAQAGDGAAAIPLHVVRDRPTVPPALARAHALLRAERPDAAEAAYTEALRDDPANAEALLGLAVAADHRGQPALAERRYRQALVADPRNVDAEAGLLNLNGAADPARTESRLKQILAAHPDAAAVHFALGNLLAARDRWADARLSYLRAHAADRGNPDYLFNLAVSLDRLHQARAARAGYQAALAARERRAGGFDPAAAQARIAALAP
ncbi:MAG: tetratricopeptide repeat protein [Rhodocyclaceae bacterium]|nr:tetratricopeptide repeat protein [Rhodocyclaceae bacterium]